MKNELEQFNALMGNSIKQLEDLIASLKLERDKLEAKPQPSVPTTIEAVYNGYNPTYYVMETSVPSLCNVNQVDAFAQLLTLVACLDSHFGEGDVYVWYIERDYEYEYCRDDWAGKPLITFKTREAAKHALEHFRPLFEQYYGVSE